MNRFLTLEDAAHYVGVSEDHFRKNALAYGIEPRSFMGTIFFREEDIREAMNRLWRVKEVPPDSQYEEARRHALSAACETRSLIRRVQAAAKAGPPPTR